MYCTHEVDAYKIRMEAEAERLHVNNGIMKLEEKGDLLFCEGEFRLPIAQARDLYANAFDCEIKQILMNSEQTELLPWEALVLGGAGKKISGISESVKIPDSIARKYISARTTLLRMIGPGPFTAAQMVFDDRTHHRSESFT